MIAGTPLCLPRGTTRGSLSQWTRCGQLVLACLLAATTENGLAAKAASEPPAPESVLTLAAALDRALERNPQLRALELERRALDARREQAGVRPNPEIAFEPENVLGSGSHSGVREAELTLAVSQLFERGNKRQLRMQVVDAQQSMAEADIATRRIELLADVARDYVALLAAQQRLLLMTDASSQAERTLAAVQARVRAAASPAAEGTRAEVALSRARLAGQRAEFDRAVARRRLAAHWGATEPDFTDVAADLYSLPAIEDFERLRSRLPDGATLRRLASEERLRTAELHLEQARRRQDFTLQAGLRRFQDSREQALVLSMSMPLPINDRNAGAIREAEIRREQLDIQRDAEVVRLQRDLYALHQELQQARREALVLRDELVPGLAQALAQTEYAYRRGRYSYLELVDAQNAVLDARLQSIAAAAACHTLVAEITRLAVTDPTEAPR